MTIHDAVTVAQWFFILYVAAMHTATLALNAIAFISLKRHMPRRVLEDMPQQYAGFEPPISVLVPAYNEQAGVVATVRSLLQVTYSELEIIVINDGSTDATLDVLKEAFSLYAFPESYPALLATKPVRQAYRSRIHPNIRVIDKNNGGKADALNAGINCARHALFCSIDGDSVLQRESLQRAVLPFMEDHRTVATGGMVRVCNGSAVRGGQLVRTGIPQNILARIQIVEYLRAFLFGRLGWSPINSLLVISGAFGVFRKDIVIQVGGYLTRTIGEDMELVVRLHRHLRGAGKPYRITFVPDPVCWTEAPEDCATLKNQRMRWQRGLAESLVRHRCLLFSFKGGTVSWLGFPYAVLFELLGPVVEVAGYAFMAAGYFLGLVSLPAALAFLVVSTGFAMVVSMNALVLEEISFHLYTRLRQTFSLFLAMFLENIGYRQMTAWWRVRALVQFTFKREAAWGAMTRKGLVPQR